jgi:hypothetical protein
MNQDVSRETQDVKFHVKHESRGTFKQLSNHLIVNHIIAKQNSDVNSKFVEIAICVPVTYKINQRVRYSTRPG